MWGKLLVEVSQSATVALGRHTSGNHPVPDVLNNLEGR
jgi:hypothetical protein